MDGVKSNPKVQLVTACDDVFEISASATYPDPQSLAFVTFTTIPPTGVVVVGLVDVGEVVEVGVVGIVVVGVVGAVGVVGTVVVGVGTVGVGPPD